MGIFCIILGIIAIVGFTGAGWVAADRLVLAAQGISSAEGTRMLKVTLESKNIHDLLIGHSNLPEQLQAIIKYILNQLSNVVNSLFGSVQRVADNEMTVKIAIVAVFAFIGLLFGASLITTGLTYRKVRRLEKRLKRRQH